MLKKILIASLLFFTTLGFSASQYDKDITVLNQSRNDKVVAVFKEMMKAYEEEDLSGFFSYVSEDRFIQDYMTFYDAIEKDMRVYDILNVDTWVDKITQDGIKRYLYVTWDKRYQSTTSDNELYKKGYSRFLFDEVNGKYKLVGLAGNNFWGGSLSEWTQDMPEIAGQVKESSVGALPDLIVSNLTSSNLTIKNIGVGDVPASQDIEWVVKCGGNPITSGSYQGGLEAGNSAVISFQTLSSCQVPPIAIVDYNNNIEESNENNNNYGGNYPNTSSQP